MTESRIPFQSWEVAPRELSASEIVEACDALLVLHRVLGRKPTVPDLNPIEAAYRALPGNSTGGSLHIILDDFNIEDEHVDFCIDYARKHDDPAGERFAMVLRVMSKTQRAKI